MAAPDEQGVQRRVAGSLVQVGRICEIVNEDQDLVQLLHLHLLGHLGYLALLVDDAPQGRLVPVLEVDLLPVGVHLHGFLDVLFDRPPAVVHVYAWRKEVDALKAAAVLFENHGDQGHRLARLAGPEQNAGGGELWDYRVVGLLALVLWGREDLDLSHRCFLSRVPGSIGRDSTWLPFCFTARKKSAATWANATEALLPLGAKAKNRRNSRSRIPPKKGQHSVPPGSCRKKGSIPFPQLEAEVIRSRPISWTAPRLTKPARSVIRGPGVTDNRPWVALYQSGTPLSFAGPPPERPGLAVGHWLRSSGSVPFAS